MLEQSHDLTHATTRYTMAKYNSYAHKNPQQVLVSKSVLRMNHNKVSQDDKLKPHRLLLVTSLSIITAQKFVVPHTGA